MGLQAAPSFSHDNGFSYNGFFVDDSLLQDMPYREKMRAAIRNQIDLVRNVGLSDEVIAFFQTLPIKINNSVNNNVADRSEYAAFNNIVWLPDHPAIFLLNGILKPVLLHEMLHAYHHEVLLHGFRNPEILAFYQAAQNLRDAQNNPVYNPDSHMMSDVMEYFACSGSIYMSGIGLQEPFNPEKIQESQPDYVTYLHTLFGPNIGTCPPFLPASF